MKACNKNDLICISLCKDEAIILLDWLMRFNERNDIEFQHQSEERILWDLESVLEKSSQAVLTNEYKVQLSKARERIKDVE